MTSPTDDRALVDTNVLVYRTDRRSPFHAGAKEVVDRGLSGDLSLVLTGQILLEYVRVMTHAKMTKTPLDMKRAWEEAAKFKAAFGYLLQPEDMIERMIALEGAVHAHGKEVFDLCHAATALAAGVTEVYTFDPTLFVRVPGLKVHAL